MDPTNTKEITVKRFSVVSAKPFSDVLRALHKGIGRPKMRELHERLADAPTFSEYEEIIKSVVGEADLIEFLRLDLGSILRKDPAAKAFQIVRIIAGNPLIMKQMVEYVPDAGSYAPVTILVYEREDGVHLCYDLMESYLASHENPRAKQVAMELDSKVKKLLIGAAT
jgi:uncharacterized protein (DUF302 family)